MPRHVYELHFDGEPDRFARMQRLWGPMPATRWETFVAYAYAGVAVVALVGLFGVLWVGWKVGRLRRRAEW